MIAIVCVDDNLGLAFNHRRQSRDAVLCRDVLALVQDKPLWMHPYSAALFPDAPDTVMVDEDYLTKAGAEDYCFVERADPSPYADKIHTLVLYRWNRTYPADVTLALHPEDYRLMESTTFAGKSHPEIVREIWTRDTIQ